MRKGRGRKSTAGSAAAMAGAMAGAAAASAAAYAAYGYSVSKGNRFDFDFKELLVKKPITDDPLLINSLPGIPATGSIQPALIRSSTTPAFVPAGTSSPQAKGSAVTTNSQTSAHGSSQSQHNPTKRSKVPSNHSGR